MNANQEIAMQMREGMQGRIAAAQMSKDAVSEDFWKLCLAHHSLRCFNGRAMLVMK